MKKIILLSTTTAFILSTNAMSNSTLDGVYITTATKTEKNIDGVSASVVVITKEDIEKISATTLKDVNNLYIIFEWIEACNEIFTLI